MSLKGFVGDSAWLFDLGFPVLRFGKKVDRTDPKSWELGDAYRLIDIKQLSEDSDTSTTRMAWSDSEVLIQVQMEHAIPMSSPEMNIALDFLINTRYSGGIHRASGFCHLYQFRLRRPFFVPLDSQSMDVRPSFITRAKMTPSYAAGDQVVGWLTCTPSRMEMKVLVPYVSLAGCDPVEFPEWGVMWVASDGRKRHSLARSPLHIPLDDPSLWCCARLVETADA